MAAINDTKLPTFSTVAPPVAKVAVGATGLVTAPLPVAAGEVPFAYG
jgi:hypothetical protein